LLGQWPQRPSINQYTEAFGEFIPQALLARSKEKVNSRQRIFSPLVTFWAFLAQVLERGSSCRDALQRTSAWWQVHFPGQGSPSADTSAYCQARARLDQRVLEQIGTQVAEQLERRVSTQQLWLGRRVKIVDGTGLSMPDTAANQLQWPQSSGQKPGCGFPLLKVVGLFCLHSGALLQVVYDNLHHHEITLARQLWQWLQVGEILLADRGFCSYQDIAQLLGRGVDCVMRLHQGRAKPDFRRGRRLGKNDRLVVWHKPPQRLPHWSKQDYDQLPKTLTLRMVRFESNVPGFRSQQVTLTTTLLDPKRYPAHELAKLYFRRWNVELHFRQIKTMLGMDVLRCLTPAMVLKELAMHRIAYNLIRALMQRAALTYDVDLERLSFKGSLDCLHHFADAICATHRKPRKQAQLFDTLLRTIASDLVPLRPNRCEPRARKRRTKNYQLLTKPRKEMPKVSHRNRPRYQS
jgi:Transposase DDE domain